MLSASLHRDMCTEQSEIYLLCFHCQCCRTPTPPSLDVWASKGRVEEILFAVMVVIIWGNTGKIIAAALKPVAYSSLQNDFVPLSPGEHERCSRSRAGKCSPFSGVFTLIEKYIKRSLQMWKHCMSGYLENISYVPTYFDIYIHTLTFYTLHFIIYLLRQYFIYIYTHIKIHPGAFVEGPFHSAVYRKSTHCLLGTSRESFSLHSTAEPICKHSFACGSSLPFCMVSLHLQTPGFSSTRRFPLVIKFLWLSLSRRYSQYKNGHSSSP